jgi:hypothetical protein
LPAAADADGCFKELQPAIQLNNKVTVLSKADVVRGFLPAGGSCSDDADVAAALARYEANWSPRDGTDPDSGARSNGFWFNTTFVSGSQHRQLACTAPQALHVDSIKGILYRLHDRRCMFQA